MKDKRLYIKNLTCRKTLCLEISLKFTIVLDSRSSQVLVNCQGSPESFIWTICILCPLQQVLCSLVVQSKLHKTSTEGTVRTSLAHSHVMWGWGFALLCTLHFQCLWVNFVGLVYTVMCCGVIDTFDAVCAIKEF